MTAIVLNTLRAAVTEYDWAFQSITPTRAGSAAGLFALGGATDAGAPIASTWIGPERVQATTLKKQRIESVYFGIRSTSTPAAGKLRIQGLGFGAYEYEFAIGSQGVSRGIPGRGFRETYFAIGYRNVAGAHYRIDRIEPVFIESTTRRL